MEFSGVHVLKSKVPLPGECRFLALVLVAAVTRISTTTCPRHCRHLLLLRSSLATSCPDEGPFSTQRLAIHWYGGKIRKQRNANQSSVERPCVRRVASSVVICWNLPENLVGALERTVTQRRHCHNTIQGVSNSSTICLKRLDMYLTDEKGLTFRTKFFHLKGKAKTKQKEMQHCLSWGAPACTESLLASATPLEATIKF